MLPESCDTSSILGGQSNFTYCQYFQWSSSALVNLISIDQLFVLDVISESIIRTIFHWKYLDVPLRIDALPCETTELDDILGALIQLLPWVCLSYL